MICFAACPRPNGNVMSLGNKPPQRGPYHMPSLKPEPSPPVKRHRFNLNEIIFGPAVSNPLVTEPAPERREDPGVDMNDLLRCIRPARLRRKRDDEP